MAHSQSPMTSLGALLLHQAMYVYTVIKSRRLLVRRRECFRKFFACTCGLKSISTSATVFTRVVFVWCIVIISYYYYYYYYYYCHARTGVRTLRTANIIYAVDSRLLEIRRRSCSRLVAKYRAAHSPICYIFLSSLLCSLPPLSFLSTTLDTSNNAVLGDLF